MALLLATLSPAAKADCTIVSGNVYDVGKYTYHTYNTANPTYKDGSRCWAAACSNAIQYWQDTYYGYAEADTPNGGNAMGEKKPEGTGILNVYNTFVQNWTNNGGYPYNGLSWWMQGDVYDEGTGRDSKPTGEASGGYYQSIYGDSPQDTRVFYDYYLDKGSAESHYTRPDLDNTKATLDAAFATQGQAVVLGIYSELTYYSHSITCWGYETDKNGKLTALIVSDSDDKKYGTTLLNVTEGVGSDGKVRTYLSTDRGNGTPEASKCYINQLTYITTPETAGGTGSQKVAIEATPNPEISSITGRISESGRITAPLSATNSVTIQGAYMTDTRTPNAIVVTSEKGAKLSIHGQYTGTTPLLKVGDGAMALLYGGIDINGPGGGVLADGHLYIHGGDVNVTNCTSATSGGGIYASDIDAKVEDGQISKAQTYVEIKGAGTINISGNKSTTARKEPDYIYEAGGGALAAEDSFTIKNCTGSITMDNNTATGYNVNGGAAYAGLYATISDNRGDVSLQGNKTQATGFASYGGAMAGIYATLSGNGDLTISGNSINVDNTSAKSWFNGYTSGAHAGGGAVAARYFNFISVTDPATKQQVYTPALLTIDGNQSVDISSNSISATYRGNSSSVQDQECEARGGALFLDSKQTSSGDWIGGIGSVSDTAGTVRFDNNSAVSNSTIRQDDTALGGAIFIGHQASMTMDNNRGGITFSRNSVGGTTAQGGAIYNDGALSVSGNKEVTFSGNSAKEGNDLYNAEGATAEFAWNGDVSFGSNTDGKAAVVNKGTLYLAAEAGKKIEFKDSKLDSSAGKVVLGTDKAGSKSTATGVSFTQGSSAMSITNREAKAAELENLTISYNLISGASDVNPVESILRGVDIVSNANLCVENVGMAADMSISTGSHAITLSNVVIDLTGTAYTTQATETGTCYIFDVRNMINCELTMANVKFDASMFDGMQVGDGDCVAVNFGDDVNISDGSNATMVRNVGETEVTINKLKLQSGVVYFGAAGADTPEINVPEPATGTFSLLALAALAARRRHR